MIKRILICGMLFAGLQTLNAQELPQKSPFSTSTNTVGLTEIKLEYSRPSVRERVIFGDLLPYGEVWRLGANASTKITISENIEIDGQLLKAGTYAMFAVPGEKEWTVAFNSVVEQWGEREYDATKNVVTFKGQVEKSDFQESLLIHIDNISFSGGELIIKWSKAKIVMPFKTFTDEQAQKNIDEAINKGEKIGQVYYNAGRYYHSMDDLKKAEVYIKQSIDEEESFRNLYEMAKIKAELGKTEDAIKLANKALEIAQKDEKGAGWVDYIKGGITEWEASLKK